MQERSEQKWKSEWDIQDLTLSEKYFPGSHLNEHGQHDMQPSVLGCVVEAGGSAAAHTHNHSLYILFERR